ncbi:androglobin-like isoform X7 [Dreissena polymorpha]|uniref:androglobin-like isoform X7 n=1 Tax=Dreissena polymorpha TaxID=45954 RepID=UPI002265216E|nr:androglobin-like isoform X7 [Dreissena polymorpha]
MSRRSSHANVTALRRGSIADAANKGAKRVSLKDGTLGNNLTSRLAALTELKEGDVFYRTERLYPSIPDHEEEVIVTLAARAARDSRTGSIAGITRDDSASTLDGAFAVERERAASIAQSATDKRPKLVIWPEWNDTDVNAEKWSPLQVVTDMAHKGKEKDKGKSPVVAHSFEDPEGKIEMPAGIKVDHWKRPQDYITEKTPVVVDQDGLSSFDLITTSEHLHESELMRYITSQIMALWEVCAVKNPPADQMPVDPNTPYEEVSHTWKPWEHIYTLNKVQKGPHVPPYNPYGKYAVRLYWMGCWRKIIVDDSMPFDDNNRLLLPSTTMQNEVWPMLLTKALIKVASLDYTGGNPNCEFGDVSIVSCLTGWLPEAIPLQGFLIGDEQAPNTGPGKHSKGSDSGRASPLVSAGQVLDKFITLSNRPSHENSEKRPPTKMGFNEDNRYGHIHEVWELLKGVLPEFKLPLQDWERALLDEEKAKRDEAALGLEGIKEEKMDTASKDSKVDKPEAKAAGKDAGKEKGAKDAKEKEKGKEPKDKKAEKEKDKKAENLEPSKRGQSRVGSSRKFMSSHVDTEDKVLDEAPIPENPEVVIFASYRSAPKHPMKVSVLGESADASERLRQNGFSHLYPHPVLVTQTRSCPLEPPPPPEKIPAWKLIRPRKKKTTPSDEPIATPEPPKPIQCVEVTSPFVNYKVSPVPIPTDTHRPKSSLERGGTRSRPGTAVGAIEETDENAPEPVKEPPKEEPLRELTPVEVVEEKPTTPSTTPSKGGKSGRKSASKKETESSPKPERKGSSKGLSSSGGKDAKEKERSRSSLSNKPTSRESSRDGAATDKTKTVEKTPEKSGTSLPVHAQLETPGTGDQAGGLAPPPENAEPGAGDTSQGEVAMETALEDAAAQKTKKKWMDFEEFCRCFKTLYIYHKPNTYPCSMKHSDLKKLEFRFLAQSVAPPPPAPTKADKKSAPAPSGVNSSPSKMTHSPSHPVASPITNPLLHTLHPGATQGAYDDKAPHYLYVDSLQPTEIVVSFSSLSRWPEPPPPVIEEKKSHTGIKGAKDKVDDKEMTNVTSSSVMEGSFNGEKQAPVVVTPGTLVAEPYSWKSLVTGQPILRLRTTAIRAAVLCLPAGRHVLKFMMSGPLGYHVHLCSSTQFVFGDEETVMSQLTKESCRFVENASQVINAIGKCINTFHDTEEFKKGWAELTAAHCPYQNEKQMSKQHHFKIFSESLYTTLRKVLRDIASPEMAFAWRAFMFDATTKNIFITPGSRPATGHTSHRGSAKQPTGTKGKRETEKASSSWENRQATTEEQVATVKLQKQWKGYWVRKIRAARQPGSEENLKVQQNLQKCWAIIEQNLDPGNPDHPGLFLFRNMFKMEPDLMVKYPFHKDEWNKISYNDYKGQYPDQSPNNWFVVFREVFHVMEEMLAVPKLYVPINTCMLRVINNDTGEEIPRVFQKVAPYVYKKNRKGYTFVAEARTTEHPLQTGTWRMRMIGSLSPLPAPQRGEMNSSFSVKEIRDYYIPNSKNVIFRYSVKVTEDHLASIQMNTSKSDVYVKLVVLNNEEEVASTLGKGHAVIPAFTFLKDINPDEEPKRSTSRASNKGDAKGKKSKRGGSGSSKDGRASTPPSRESPRAAERSSQMDHHSDGGLSDGDLEERDLRPHKYIVEAQVLKDSWPLSESSWQFVQMLKELEKNELKVSFKEKAAEEPPKAEKTTASVDKTKGAAAKGAKGAKDKGKDKDSKGSRPPSQQFDLMKPHWTFRIVSDANAAEDIEVKKDTERADEIRALKKAWEEAEPGRAAKAMQSRLKYLKEHTIKLGGGDEETLEGEKLEGEGGADTTLDIPPQTPGSFLGEDDGTLTLEPPTPPTPKEILQPVDYTPFIIRTEEKPRYLDETESRRKMEEQQLQISEYKAFRQQVEEWRRRDRELRNQTKEKQILECEELQAMLDEARKAVNEPREAFRQKYLEAERKRLEEINKATEAQLKEAEAKSPKGKKGSAKGKKSPSANKKKK